MTVDPVLLKKSWIVTIAHILVGFIGGPVLIYLLSFLSFLPWRAAFAISIVCGVGIALALPRWRLLGWSWATGTLLHSSLLYYLFITWSS